MVKFLKTEYRGGRKGVEETLQQSTQPSGEKVFLKKTKREKLAGGKPRTTSRGTPNQRPRPCSFPLNAEVSGDRPLKPTSQGEGIRRKDKRPREGGKKSTSFTGFSTTTQKT